MDVEKIIKLINASKKIFEPILTGDDQFKVLAAAYSLIRIGENIHDVIVEIQNHLKTQPKLFKELTQQEVPYSEALFRTSFGNTPIGTQLLLLNTIRNKTKHQFFSFKPEERKIYAEFYSTANIHGYLENLRKAIRNWEGNSEDIVKNLFQCNTIERFDKHSASGMDSLMSKKSSTKKKTLDIDGQERKLLKRFQDNETLQATLTECGQLLKTNDSTKGNIETTILPATLMCLTVMGENATQLIAYSKNERLFPSEIRNILTQYKDELSDLSLIATRLTHSSLQKPNIKHTINIVTDVLTRFATLKKLQLELTEKIAHIKKSEITTTTMVTSSSPITLTTTSTSSSSSSSTFKLSERVGIAHSPVFTPLPVRETTSASEETLASVKKESKRERKAEKDEESEKKDALKKPRFGGHSSED